MSKFKPVWYVYVTRRGGRDIATQNLIYAVQEIGCEVFIERYVPFSDPEVFHLPVDRPVVFQGAIGVALRVKEKCPKIRPFAWFDPELLTCHSYYAHWGKYLGPKVYGLYPLGELRRLKDWFYDAYGIDDTIFIRPDTNDKTFTGERVYRENFDSFMNWNFEETLGNNSLAVVSSPIRFLTEWRFVVADKKVVAGSQYKDGTAFCTDPHYPPEAAAFAEEVANVWSPHPIYCLDIGLTKQGYCVVECGSVNCAGYYQCDIRPIVESMTSIAVREFYE